ncbi:hypothetical protein M440DRAFT_1032370 [Trichoderma longibrachiatum ATCC 18648]|uniref:Uncharacterized protein n=1 Tax=Trichoderma longibrachiatum ATCC 18648 TaxID=983965 RepID=A0A2T4BZC7_TRILO|nr:hypothetical protein M440DRAFT_1032370 [Trichoderma longibrachiatum ATCC 18648]
MIFGSKESWVFCSSIMDFRFDASFSSHTRAYLIVVLLPRLFFFSFIFLFVPGPSISFLIPNQPCPTMVPFESSRVTLVMYLVCSWPAPKPRAYYEMNECMDCASRTGKQGSVGK